MPLALVHSLQGVKLLASCAERQDFRQAQVIAFTQVCQVVPLDTEIALAAAEACRTQKLATADAIVFATARARGATLLTCDAHFKVLPGVTLVEKIKV